MALCNNHEKVSQLLECHRQACKLVIDGCHTVCYHYREIVLATKGHRQLQKANSNPSKNLSIVDGHVGLQKFLEANPNFFDQKNSTKRPNPPVLFDKDKTITPHSSTSCRPKTLQELLDQLQLSKYFVNFEQQEIDLCGFLQMTDTDLKEIGIK